jgi:hypothetical protein
MDEGRGKMDEKERGKEKGVRGKAQRAGLKGW